MGFRSVPVSRISSDNSLFAGGTAAPLEYSDARFMRGYVSDFIAVFSVCAVGVRGEGLEARG